MNRLKFLREENGKTQSDVAKYLGIPFTGHQLRHTYATMLYNSNVPIKEAQYFLGHKDIRILLNIYTHLDDEKKKQSISKVNEFLSKE